MLKLINITKNYGEGESAVQALKGVDIEFRKNEFVSILGQSGCGKTTLLNIIGGLDRYTEGDLIISGRSTKEYSDHDWDTYRNHSIGFVFQNYNLISHQTVLSNVELALTLSGVSKAERKARAIAALEKVGLSDQIHKKPNQMSGGQMQRVAIARALINDPEILLADEPTGALDSETSEQIMELLKEVAHDRLVIMVTHNPELADRYSTRIIRLLDGLVVDDTDPYNGIEDKKEESAEGSVKPAKKPNKKKAKKGTSMSFFTALSLSFNNLLTKKGRTFMTSFAGSIGIIGIALILSLSTGFQAYIDNIQEETLSSYPITISAEQNDMSKLFAQMAGKDEERATRPDGKVYPNTDMYDMMDAMLNPETKTNNLEKFKEWLEEDGNEIMNYISAVQYGYSAPLEVYGYDLDKGVISANDYMSLFKDLMGDSVLNMMGGMMNTSSVNVFQEILQSKDGKEINPLMFEQYELVDDGMRWPSNKNEIVLVVDKNNEISETFLFTLGMLDRSTIEDIMADMTAGEGDNDLNSDKSWDYSEIIGTKYRLILPTDKYLGKDKDRDGVNDYYEDISKDDEQMKVVLGAAEELEIVGIIRPKEGVVASAMTGAVGYLHELTEWYLEKIGESELIKSQLANPTIDVIKGIPFKTADYVEPTEAEKAAAFKEWAEAQTPEEKIKLYYEISMIPPADATEAYITANMPETRDGKVALILDITAKSPEPNVMFTAENLAKVDDATLEQITKTTLAAAFTQIYAAEKSEELKNKTHEQILAEFSASLNEIDEATLAALYDNKVPETVSKGTYYGNLELMGYSILSKPSSVNIYCASFENKDKVAELITAYNKGVAEEDKITYTDYVALMMSSISTIINVISYVLIAFVSISLIVSSIMIGIITYISVLERTKEIGILRSIGASKKDISRVFNAETMIVGFVSGTLGIVVTLLLLIPINIIIKALTDIANVAVLPPVGAIILVAISVGLTLIAGLIPSRVAAKKDPVEALRTE